MTTPATSGLGPSHLSFQIPDLLAATSTFTFRTNKHCKLATDWSEKWLLSNGPFEPIPATGKPFELNERETNGLRGLKYGLLASLTSPTSDAPQLKVLADFWALVFMSQMRLLETKHGWASEDQVHQSQDGLDLLRGNDLMNG